MLIATMVYFFYTFTWSVWSAWMPQFLANEKHLGFHTTESYLSIWMFVAIFAYCLCGWLSDVIGRRFAIPGFVVPASVLLAGLGYLDQPASLFWAGLAANFLITGSFGVGMTYAAELFPTQIRGTAVGASFVAGAALGALAPMFLFVARETTRRELTDFVERAHIGEPDRGRQQLRIVGAGGDEQFVDLAQHLVGLLAYAGGRVFADLASEVDGRTVRHRLAHPRAHLVPLDRHRWPPAMDG
jgi:Major Facilitator Superfamily